MKSIEAYMHSSVLCGDKCHQESRDPLLFIFSMPHIVPAWLFYLLLTNMSHKEEGSYQKLHSLRKGEGYDLPNSRLVPHGLPSPHLLSDSTCPSLKLQSHLGKWSP